MCILNFTPGRRGSSCEGPPPPRRDLVPRRRARVVPALERAVVHGVPRRGRLRGLVGAVAPRGRRVLDRRGENPMTGLEIVLAVAGGLVTLLVIAGMILLTPRGEVTIDTGAP